MIPNPTVTKIQHSTGHRQLMALSKMNWNCADFSTTQPITLRFARQVGDIMSELREGQQARGSFKFYM